MVKLNELTIEEKLRLLCGEGSWNTCGLDGKIPSLLMCDGPHGVRKVERVGENGEQIPLKSIAYPALQCLTNTWNRKLARAMGEALADDCKEKDVDILLAPGVNIKRNPLNGRNFEYFSEDPFLAGTMACEYVDGLQKNGVAACVKHYCCNNEEHNRLEQSSEVDERTLREIYLKPFEWTFRAHPEWIMCSYNRVNGVRASEHGKLFDTARKELGFDGAVMSDWGAVYDRTAAVKAGVDLEMPFSRENYERLVADYKAGKIDEREIDVCVERILGAVEKRLRRRGEKVKRSEKERLAVAQEIAEEGLVLLKNDGVLPLENGQSVSVLGRYGAGEKDYTSGGGAAQVLPLAGDVTLAEALKEVMPDSEIDFEKAFNADGIESYGEKPHRILERCAQSDVSVICVGTGRFVEYESADRTTLKLHPLQEELILQTAAQNPDTVVVLYAGGAVDVSAWADEVAAIVYAGFNGERGNRAVANVLAGKVSPSGKLSETFPVCLEDTPYYDTYRDVTVARYTDGVDVGYRYYETAGVGVQYEFGFGLSYAEFEYGDLEIELKGGLNAEVSYTVKNISDYDGKEISQLYVRDAVAFVYRPDLELKGYAKNYIKAGDCAEVKLTLDRSSFAYYSAAKDEWIVDDGVFNVFVGASVKDIRLEAAVVVENGGIVKVKIL